MSQKLPDSYVLLAGLPKLWPVGGNLLVVIQEPPRVGRSDRQGTDTLGGGEDEHHGVLLPGSKGFAIPVAAPKVDDLAPSVVDSAGCAHLSTLREVLLELGGDPLETWRNLALEQAYFDPDADIRFAIIHNRTFPSAVSHDP